MLHLMHHEATACHVTEDIVILLTLMTQVLDTARKYITDKKCERISVQIKFLSIYRAFQSAVKQVHTVPWSHCPNKNVFSNCLKLLYDKSG